jgi:predicted ATPase
MGSVFRIAVSEVVLDEPQIVRHGLDRALAEYSRLLQIYPSFGYEVSILPKVGVEERADFVLRTLET